MTRASDGGGEQTSGLARPSVQTRAIGHAFGWLMVAQALVWATTMLVSVVAAKASPQFFWILLVLIVGASASGVCIEIARRRCMP